MTAKASNIHSDRKKKKTNTGKRAVRDGPEGTLISPESDTSGGPTMPEPKSKSPKASAAHPADAKKEVIRKLRLIYSYLRKVDVALPSDLQRVVDDPNAGLHAQFIALNDNLSNTSVVDQLCRQNEDFEHLCSNVWHVYPLLFLQHDRSAAASTQGTDKEAGAGSHPQSPQPEPTLQADVAMGHVANGEDARAEDAPGQRSGVRDAWLDGAGLVPYKGWMTEPPKVSLAWIKNFLSDEDIDRTPKWNDKVAEILEYVQYLQDSYDGEDWVDDLLEVTGLLRTHKIIEDYYHRPSRVQFDRPNLEPRASTRLPPVAGSSITHDLMWKSLNPDTGSQRRFSRLMLQETDSGYAGTFNAPPDILEECYQEPLRQDIKQTWDSEFIDSGVHMEDPETSYAHEENEHYEKGMGSKKGAKQAAAHALEDQQHWLVPNRITKDKQGRQTVPDELLRDFSALSGSRRATMQHTLNLFDGENTGWLGDSEFPVKLVQPAAPSTRQVSSWFEEQKLQQVPGKEARDSFRWTRALRQHKRITELNAQQTRDHATHEWQSYTKELGLDGKVLDLPSNYQGPIASYPVDRSTSMRLEEWQICNELRDTIRKSAHRSPRPFIAKLDKLIDIGRTSASYQQDLMNLTRNEVRLRPLDYDAARAELSFLRFEEINLLRSLGRTSRRRPTRLDQPLDQVGRLLAVRIVKMIGDVGGEAFFSEHAPRPFKEFMMATNEDCDGPVKGYRFTEEEVLSHLENMSNLGLLNFEPSTEKTGLLIGRPPEDIHPENTVWWDDDAGHDQSTVPDHASTLGSIFHGDSGHLPVAHKLSISKDVSLQSSRDREQVTNLFYTLGYRLGKTLAYLEVEKTNAIARLEDKANQETNAHLMSRYLEFWQDNTAKLPNKGLGTSRKLQVSTYADIVHSVDPESWKREWDPRQPRHDWAEHECRELVRRNVLREAYENKPMLWPRQVAVGTDDDGNVQKLLRREALWSFAHPSKGRVTSGQWDTSRWLAYQDALRAQGRITGDDPAANDSEELDDMDVDMTETNSNTDVSVRDDEENVDISWVEFDNRGVKYHKAPNGFLGGETKLQREAMINNLRGHLETRDPPRTWRDRLRTLTQWWSSGEDDVWVPEAPKMPALLELDEDLFPQSVLAINKVEKEEESIRKEQRRREEQRKREEEQQKREDARKRVEMELLRRERESIKRIGSGIRELAEGIERHGQLTEKDLSGLELIGIEESEKEVLDLRDKGQQRQAEEGMGEDEDSDETLQGESGEEEAGEDKTGKGEQQEAGPAGKWNEEVRDSTSSEEPQSHQKQRAEHPRASPDQGETEQGEPSRTRAASQEPGAGWRDTAQNRWKPLLGLDDDVEDGWTEWLRRSPIKQATQQETQPANLPLECDGASLLSALSDDTDVADDSLSVQSGNPRKKARPPRGDASVSGKTGRQGEGSRQGRSRSEEKENEYVSLRSNHRPPPPQDMSARKRQQQGDDGVRDTKRARVEDAQAQPAQVRAARRSTRSRTQVQ
ncbi:hypothetical protein S40293_02324 [Stachybotrys chartarum IBT 40293]|nr:hypothetical protein S40293_02324 [Stachybotrys chartarum IBT 40293]